MIPFAFMLEDVGSSMNSKFGGGGGVVVVDVGSRNGGTVVAGFVGDD